MLHRHAASGIKNGLLLVLLLAVPAITAQRAVAATVDYTGHYELALKDADRSFSLDIAQIGSHAKISFSAAMADGSGSAPDADGKGTLDPTGALTFTFKDSFENEGTGSLTAEKDGYHLKLTMTKVVEPRPLRFYGDLLLRKTSNTAQSSDT